MSPFGGSSPARPAAPHAAISGAILAGGQSRRFGSDKALAPSPIDGRPLLAVTIDRVRQVVDDLVVVAPLDRGYGAFGAEVVPRGDGGRGPTRWD
jgi:molybdopterin-guanine dinucleotide biosynthesis protein A